MNVIALSPLETAAISQALKYWLDRWDWESPTLFGLTKAEFLAASSSWPNAGSTRQGNDAQSLAAVGALRELLHGARPLAPAHIQPLLGMDRQAAEHLLDRIASQCRVKV